MSTTVKFSLSTRRGWKRSQRRSHGAPYDVDIDSPLTLVQTAFANAALLALLSTLQPLVRDARMGLGYATGNMDERRDEGVLAARLVMVVRNRVEATALLVPVVLVALSRSAEPAGVGLACTVFLGSRVVYALVSLAGVPVLRSTARAVGFGAAPWSGRLVWGASSGKPHAAQTM